MRRILTVCLTAALLPLLSGQTLPDRQMHWIMGTFWEIETPGVPASDAMAAAFAEIRRLDGLLSHYQPDSAISRLNRSGHLGDAPEVAALLARSVAYSRESGGAFDVTVAPLVDLWGFKQMVPHVPSRSELDRTRRRVGDHRLHVQNGAITLDPGTTVELGAIGKGYALDRAMAVLAAAGIRRARIDAGGQQLVRGTWTIGIQHPRKNGLLGRITLANGSISTSGDMERFFVHKGKRYNHLIDPRTGYPTTDWPSVTVTAPDGESADALSTVAAVLGPTGATPILKAHHGEALWVGTNGSTAQTAGFRLDGRGAPAAPR
jgi:thiamine biosynthesis lipoprotein